MSTETIYHALDVASWELQRMHGIRAWRRWLKPALYAKLCRQFDTFWFELRSRMRMFDAMRAPMPSSTRELNGLPDARIVSARYPGATITTTGEGQPVVWIYANGGIR